LGASIARRIKQHRPAIVQVDVQPGDPGCRCGAACARRAQAFVNDLAQQIIFRPGEKFHFGDELGPYPMHGAQNKRRSETAAARRRHLERHFVGRERLQAMPQPLVELGRVDAGAGAAGIDQLAVRIVIGEQQRAEIRCLPDRSSRRRRIPRGAVRRAQHRGV
jgi:hypothetical protein